MSKKYKTVKAAYDRGSWNKEMVANAVIKGWITEEEYQLITGDPFPGWYTPAVEMARKFVV